MPRLAPKIRRREETRERKAEAAAKVERAIERELIERLRSGAYGEKPINVEEGIWKRVLRGLERAGEGTRDRDLDEGVEEEEQEEGEKAVGRESEDEEEEEEGEAEIEYVSGDEFEEEDEKELADLEDWLGENGDAPDVEDDPEGDDELDGSIDSDDESGANGSETEGAKVSEKAAVGSKRKKQAPAQVAKRRKGPQLEIEYEEEFAAPLSNAALAR